MARHVRSNTPMVQVNGGYKPSPAFRRHAAVAEVPVQVDPTTPPAAPAPKRRGRKLKVAAPVATAPAKVAPVATAPVAAKPAPALPAAQTLGANIVGIQSGNLLLLTIDPTVRLGASKSGKTVLIASTHGNIEVSGSVRLGVNCYTRDTSAPAALAPAGESQYGDNVTGSIGRDGKIRLVIDTSRRGGLSASGKTLRVASTEGNVQVVAGISLGLNAYAYPTPK